MMSKMVCSDYDIEKCGCSEAELRALYLLNNMKGMLSDKLLRIYEHFGSYEYAYNADVREYIEAGLFVRSSMQDAFAELKKRETLLLRRAGSFEKNGIHLVSMFDKEYPQRLDHIRNKPPLLYVSGKLPEDSRRSAAIVGSRKCSEYGRTVAEMFAAELAEYGVQIVSGLAHGIDAAAAKGSLRTANESYGVLGCGINICYPRYNEVLYDRMRRGEGGIVSELPLDTPAIGYNFVLRNRIISGLSDVLIVIEAGRKSGTTITVGYALEQGREVYALPGRIDDPLGYGCNQFIKEGANIITEAADVLRYFEISREHAGAIVPVADSEKAENIRRSMDDDGNVKCCMDNDKNVRSGMDNDENVKHCMDDDGNVRHCMDDDERQVYDVLKLEPQHLEHIAAQAGLNVSDAVTALMTLEAKRIIRSPRYAYYQRIGIEKINSR